MARRPGDYELHVIMSRELRDRLHAAARNEHRTMASHLRHLIETHTPET